jgi:hypothetical protein
LLYNQLTKIGNHIKHHHCQNCKTPLPNLEEYCPNCGQLNHDLKIPLKHLFLEILESTFHFETTFWVTLKNLLFFPGKITKEFIAGKRATYMNPFRMYVFVSIIFFLLLGKLTNNSKQEQIAEKLKTLNQFKIEKNSYDSLKNTTRNFDPKTLDSIISYNDTRNEKIMDSIFHLNSDNIEVIRIQSNIAKFKYSVDDTIGLTQRINEVKKQHRFFTPELIKLNDDEIGVLAADIIQDSDIDGNDVFLQEIDSMPPLTYEDNIKIHGFTSEQFDSLAKKRPKLFNGEKGSIEYFSSIFTLKVTAKNVFYNDQNYFVNSIFKSMSLAMFFIMPLFGLMLRIFFIRRKLFYYETLVFSIHFHTFIFIVFSFFFLLNIILKNKFPLELYYIPSCLMILNLFLALKKVFNQGYIKSLIKEILIIFSFAVVLIFIMTAIVILSFLN